MDPNLETAVGEITKADTTISTLRLDLADAQRRLEEALTDAEASRQQVLALQAEVARLQAIIDAGNEEPDPPAQVKIGASFKPSEYLPDVVTHLDTHRHFFQPGDFTRTQTWDGQPALLKAYNEYGCRVFSISVKPDVRTDPSSTLSAASQARLGAFLDSAPDDVELLLTFYHEHDGNLRDGSLTKAAYISGSQQVANLAHARGMKYGPIHNGNVRQNGSSGPWGLWPEIWAQNEADLSLYDFWGVDCYSDSYQDPSPRMDPIRGYADSLGTLGLPVLIGELASPLGTQQAAWAAKAREWALANARWAHWWSSQKNEPNATNYRLTTGAAQAWFGLT